MVRPKWLLIIPLDNLSWWHCDAEVDEYAHPHMEFLQCGHLRHFCHLATAPLARTKKGGARRGGAKVKNNSAVAVARKKITLIHAIFEPNVA